MSEFLKCECLHCGQRLEFQAEGIGLIVSCPTCAKPVTLTGNKNIPKEKQLTEAVRPNDSETQRQKEWEQWKATHLRQAWKPSVPTLPTQCDPQKLLPEFSDHVLRFVEVKSSDLTKTYIVDLLSYTCSCPLCVEIHAKVPKRDFGRLCKHIIIALREKNLVKHLPTIAKGIANNGYPNAYGIIPGRFEKDLYGNAIYVTGENRDGWVNVYALARRDGVNYYRFGFHAKTRRWCRIMPSGAYNWAKPPVDELILC